MDIATLQKTLDEIAAEYVRRLNLRVESIDASADSVTLSLPVTPELVHAGGVLCGQAIMSAADTAMLVAMIAKIGGFRPMTTVQLQASFLRPVPKETASVTVVARLLRFGKTLSYGEVVFLAPDLKIVAHTTTTYALI
jgi:uncharacterized protein (TIGR00369 family)